MQPYGQYTSVNRHVHNDPAERHSCLAEAMLAYTTYQAVCMKQTPADIAYPAYFVYILHMYSIGALCGNKKWAQA
jgi:hypothetical protein